MKRNADKFTSHRVISVGDKVLVRQEKKNEYSTPFNTELYWVTKVDGTKITAKNKNGHEITRNISFFKHFHGESQGDFDSDDDSSEAVVVDNRGATDERDQEYGNNVERRYPLRSNRGPPQRLGDGL